MQQCDVTEHAYGCKGSVDPVGRLARTQSWLLTPELAPDPRAGS